MKTISPDQIDKPGTPSDPLDKIPGYHWDSARISIF